MPCGPVEREKPRVCAAQFDPLPRAWPMSGKSRIPTRAKMPRPLKVRLQHWKPVSIEEMRCDPDHITSACAQNNLARLIIMPTKTND
jgi:hypothetical protein